MVVLPGIGGSVLERGGEQVWGGGPSALAGRALRPDVLARFEGDGIRATGFVRAPTVLPGFASLRAYDALVGVIVRRFPGVVVDWCHPDAQPVVAADVLCVPYDFRRSLVECAEDVDRVVGARAGERPVVVVAHSFGGLVARWWLRPGGGGRLRCRALLTLGTPHRGAPKALDWLVNGVRLGRLRLGGATEVVRSWPSAYELLPRYPAVLDQSTEQPLRPHELVAEGFDASAAAAAFGVHQEIERSWDASPDHPRVTPLLGRYQPTLERAALFGRTLRVEKRRAEWLPSDDWAGDGTVPAFSAIPLELAGPEDAESRRSLSARHSALPQVDQVVDWLVDIEGADTRAVRDGGAEARPSLGLDVDEWYPAGEPVEVAGYARGPGGDIEGEWTGARLKVTAQAFGGRPAMPVEAELAVDDCGHWTGQVPGLDPGTYELVLTGPGRRGGEAPPVREIVAVVDAEAPFWLH